MAAPDPLKSPNVRGKGISTVRRDSSDSWPEIGGNDVIVKVQRGYDCRPLWNWGRRTPVALRERRALLGCRAAGVHVPLVLEYRQTEEGAELTTTVVPDALSLDVALERYADQRSRILANAGFEIGKLHRARWTHGALYSDHILVCPDSDFRVYLIDLEKGRRSIRTARDLARFERYNSYLTGADLGDFRRGYESGRQPPASAP